MSESLSQRIYQIFTAKTVRRAWPLKPSEVQSHIQWYLDQRKPIILTTNWLGVKTTPLGVADGVDETTLDFLKSNIIDQLEKFGVPVLIKLLFTDINASYLGGYPKQNIERYWETLKPTVDKRGSSFSVIRVNSELWDNLFNLDGGESFLLPEIAEKIHCTDLLEEVSARANKVIKGQHFARFVLQAQKHSLLVKNKLLSPEEAAQRYVYFRIFARRRYKKLFPREIYFSYAQPELNELIVSQQTVYWFSYHKGCSECPWSVDENSERFVRLMKNRL